MQDLWSRLYAELILKLDAPDAQIMYDVNIAQHWRWPIIYNL